MALPLRLARFVALARLLGVEQYGLFVAASAFVGFAAPFAGWGFGFLIARHVARDRSSFRLWWGNCILAVLLTGIPLTIVLALVGGRFLPGSSVLLVLVIAGADLLFGRIIDMAERAYRAHWKMASAAFLTLIPELGRTLMLVPFLFVETQTAATWATWQFVGVALSGALIVIGTTRDLGQPVLCLSSLLSYVRDGTHFAIGQSAGTIHTNIDRVMLGRLASLEATGVYSAAAVVISMGTLPIMSLSRAMMARYFELGGRSVRHTVRFAWQNILGGMVYAVPASVALLVAAPIIPIFVGSEYANSVQAIRWLAVLPVFFVLTDVAGSTISAIDRPQDRTKVLIAIAILNVLLNLWLIPLYSWRGAALATLIAEVILAVGLWGVILFWMRRSPNLNTHRDLE